MKPSHFVSSQGLRAGENRAVLRPAALLAALFMVTACAGNSEEATQRSVWVVDGPPTSCISTNQLRSMRVIDDRTIHFEMTGRRVYRNELPFRCTGLSFNQSIRHNGRTSRLCNLNTVTPRSPGGGWREPSCQLGMFQPIKRTQLPVAPAPEQAVRP